MTIDPQRIALGIRQPWAELILRGIKTFEVRSQSVALRETIYVYASKKISTHPAAESAIDQYELDVESLDRGVLIGTVKITDCLVAEPSHRDRACVREADLVGNYCWELSDPDRFAEPVMPKFLPFGVWFYPFRRKGSS